MDASESGPAKPSWQPLPPIDRRVAGVLVEKAKTTPEAYPLSLNALVTGCNQKSNRHPIMHVEAEDVEPSLERLRALGAVTEVQGGGRVPKYRHCMYEWLGVEKVELSVMAELLLRGAQTEGELRSRASRMDPIADLPALRAILHGLKARGLVVSLTPEGRGHVVTHALYQERELETLRSEFAAQRPAVPAAREEAPAHRVDRGHGETIAPVAPVPAPGLRQVDTPHAGGAGEVSVFAGQLEQLRTEVAQLRSDLEDLLARHTATEDEVRRLRDALGA